MVNSKNGHKKRKTYRKAIGIHPGAAKQCLLRASKELTLAGVTMQDRVTLSIAAGREFSRSIDNDLCELKKENAITVDLRSKKVQTTDAGMALAGDVAPLTEAAFHARARALLNTNERAIFAAILNGEPHSRQEIHQATCSHLSEASFDNEVSSLTRIGFRKKVPKRQGTLQLTEALKPFGRSTNNPANHQNHDDGSTVGILVDSLDDNESDLVAV